MTKKFKHYANDGSDGKPKTKYVCEFMDRIREAPVLSSYDGFRVFDIDGFISNEKYSKCILVETKTRGVMCSPSQERTLSIINNMLSLGSGTKANQFEFKGTFLFQFENLGPHDGLTFIYRMHNNYFGGYKHKEILLRCNNENEVWNFIEKILTP